MTGRSAFNRIKPVVTLVNLITKLLPRLLFVNTWWIVQGIPGLPGVLARYIYVQRLAKKCGDNVMIGPRCTILAWENISFGSNVTLHVGGYIDAVGGVSIGNNVSIAHSCSILSFEHTWDDKSLPIKYNTLSKAAVFIADDVWVGCGVRVLSGSVINHRTVIAAGAVVKRGTYGSGVYGGVPAKLIKQIQ